MARVFSAVDIEEESLLEELKDVRDRLDLSFNRVEARKMHVTFQFFKDVDPDQLERIKAAMDGIELQSFEAEVKGVGAFPSRDYIRVIWAGVENGKLQELYNQASGHSVEDSNDHDFKPHITFLRVQKVSREKKKKLQRMIDEFEDHSFGNLNVKRVKLFESELKPSGSVYKQLHVKELE